MAVKPELVEKLDREIAELRKALEVSPMQNAIQEKLGELYRAWAVFGPEDGFTINMLNNLMLLYDKWLD